MTKAHGKKWEEHKLELKKFSCDKCGKMAVSLDSLRKHKCQQQLVATKTKAIAKAKNQTAI